MQAALYMSIGNVVPSARWCRGIGLVALLAMGLLIASASAQARVVRVGVYENAPKLHLSKNGTPDGILGRLLVAIAEAEHWTLKAVPCSWQECLAALQAGRIDLLPDVAGTEERRLLFDFHTVPALHGWSQIYAQPDDAIESLLALHGMRIATMDQSIQASYLAALASGFGIRPTLVNVDSMEAGFALVSDGEADAVATSYHFGQMHAGKYGLVALPLVFLPSQLFYVTDKGINGDVLAAIDRHLARWQADPDSLYFQTLEQWGQAVAPDYGIPTRWWLMLGGLLVLLVAALAIATWLKTQVARQTRHLSASEDRLNAILDSVDAAIYIKDRQLRYQYGNRKVCQHYGLDLFDLVGQTDELFHKGADLATLRENDLRVIKDGERVAAEEQQHGAGGKIATYFSIKIPLRDRHGRVEALCGISTDITDHKAAQEAAHRLANYDSLTGLPNRRQLLERIAPTLQAIQEGNGVGALVLVDLDNFKRINDVRGHVIGDQLLCAASARLKDHSPDDSIVARIGGDEFVVLLPQLSRHADGAARRAIHIADQLRAVLEQPVMIAGQPCVCGGSIGVTLLRPEGKSTEDVLREANTALHRSKEAGRNRVAFFETGMQTELEERLSLEQDLAAAIGTEQLEMHLQPQHDVAGAVVGVELLIRWNHPSRGPVPPARFIPIAEETGIILRIGDWTLLQACRTLLELQEKGRLYPVSINVSPRQFRQPDFVHRVREILQETGAPAERLTFEVTEGILIEDIQGATDKMSELATMGIRFSIDDFGTGYSNLTYLKRFPLHELKIDKSFLHDTPIDPDNRAIVKLILAMARQLNLKVVAEGVETQAQANFLIEQGCDSMQGYLFARPVPIAQWLQSQTA